MPHIIVDLLGLSRVDIVVRCHRACVQEAASRVVGRIPVTSTESRGLFIFAFVFIYLFLFLEALYFVI